MNNIREDYEILTTMFYKNNEYIEAVDKNGELIYFKKGSNNKYKQISKQEYERESLSSSGIHKVTGIKKIENKFKSLLKNLILPTLLLSLAASATSGCRKEDNTNRQEIVQEENNADKEDSSLTELKITETPGVTNLKPIFDGYNDTTVEELQSYGVKLRKIPNDGYDGYTKYFVEELNVNKLPENTVIDYYMSLADFDSFKIVDTLPDISNIDIASDIYDRINNLDIQEEYKTKLLNAYNIICESNNNTIKTILTWNLKRCEVEIDENHPSAQFNTYIPRIILGKSIIRDNEALREYYESIGVPKEDIELLIEDKINTAVHELGHGSLEFYDRETKELRRPARLIFIFENKTNRLVYIDEIGNSFAEYTADYITYDRLNYKPNKYQSYTISDSFYLAILDMLGMNTMEDIENLNIEKIINKFCDIEMTEITSIIELLDNENNQIIDMMNAHQNQENIIDYTEAFTMMLDVYYSKLIDNGKSTEDIQIIFDKIVNDLKERITHNEINDEDYIIGFNGTERISLTEIINHINLLTNRKEAKM